MATDQLTYTGALVVVKCWCGIRSAVPDSLYRHARQSPKNHIFCPLGHQFVYSESEADALRAKLDQAEADARYQASRRHSAESEARQERDRAKAAKALLEKDRKRVANGVCPCCNRSFTDLARHMGTKHPDFARPSWETLDLSRMTLRSAVLAVLGTEPMTLQDVLGALTLAGHRGSPASLQPTLSKLVTAGPVAKAGRGLFVVKPEEQTK